MINIGIIGLGHIGNYHIQALSNLPELKLVAACDLNTEYINILPENVKFYTVLEDFFNDSNIDTVIIATPNKSHFNLGISAYHSGKNIIMEKPAVSSIKEFNELDGLFQNSSSQHIYYAFHAAKALDVIWFKKYLNDKKNYFGNITSFVSHFYDHYFKNGKIIEKAKSLENSWIDSGVNALSVLEEFIGIKNLKFEKYYPTKIMDDIPVIQAIGQFSFPIDKTFQAGMGIINTNWTTGINKKQTILYFAHKGYAVELDHSNQKVILTEPAGTKKVLKDFSSSGDRLYNHYLGVFSDYIQCVKINMFNNNSSKLIHKMLFNNPTNSTN